MFIRSHKNPLLESIDNHSWESLKVYNPGIILAKGEYHLFYRAMGSNLMSSIGYAYSFDGENFIRYDQPLLLPTEKIEQNGIEDPRITKLGNGYFMTYTAYDGICARLCYAVSDDLKSWKKRGEMIPDWNGVKAKAFELKHDSARNNKIAKKEWIKSGGIFPDKINGEYWMLFGDSNIWMANSKDGIEWVPVWKPFLEPRTSLFDSLHLEMGPPPIKTEKGWLVLYHGIDRYLTYRLGYLLLDLDDPGKIIYRSKLPIFWPETEYELSGIEDIARGGLKQFENMDEEHIRSAARSKELNENVPKIIFCNGAIREEKRIRIFYGAADTAIATAYADLEKF
jgi:predicted GH43/DUF377 family glycosyl hydrolase